MSKKKIVTVGNTLMGKVKYASLRKKFSYIDLGEKIPKHNYMFRVYGEIHIFFIKYKTRYSTDQT